MQRDRTLRHVHISRVGVHVIEPGTICLVVRPDDDDGEVLQFFGRTTTVQGRLAPLCQNCGSVQYITDLRWPDGFQLVACRKFLRPLTPPPSTNEEESETAPKGGDMQVDVSMLDPVQFDALIDDVEQSASQHIIMARLTQVRERQETHRHIANGLFKFVDAARKLQFDPLALVEADAVREDER